MGTQKYYKIVQEGFNPLYVGEIFAAQKICIEKNWIIYEHRLLTKLMVLKPFWWPCREASFIFQERTQYSTQLPIPDLESSHTGCPVIQAQYTLARSSNIKMKNLKVDVAKLWRCTAGKNKSRCYQGWRSAIYIRNYSHRNRSNIFQGIFYIG